METKKVKLVYGDSEIEIMCDETILEGAYRNGLKLNYQTIIVLPVTVDDVRCRLFPAKPESITLAAYPARIFQQDTF